MIRSLIESTVFGEFAAAIDSWMLAM